MYKKNLLQFAEYGYTSKCVQVVVRLSKLPERVFKWISDIKKWMEYALMYIYAHYNPVFVYFAAR